MVCLTNRQAGSGGDMLPMEFQMRGMGPVIGTRTWGGLVGVSMFISLIDGGGLTEHYLDSPPVWDGMAAARGRLFLSTTGGKVLCLGGAE